MVWAVRVQVQVWVGKEAARCGVGCAGCVVEKRRGELKRGGLSRAGHTVLARGGGGIVVRAGCFEDARGGSVRVD